MNLKLKNSQSIDQWIFHHAQELGHVVVAVKGPHPEGYIDEEGEIPTYPLNTAWVDTATDERIDAEWEVVNE